jgi:hypothetical protein
MHRLGHFIVIAAVLVLNGCTALREQRGAGVPNAAENDANLPVFTQLELQMPRGWTLRVDAAGGGRLSSGPAPILPGQLPPGTFADAQLLEVLAQLVPEQPADVPWSATALVTNAEAEQASTVIRAWLVEPRTAASLLATALSQVRMRREWIEMIEQNPPIPSTYLAEVMAMEHGQGPN